MSNLNKTAFVYPGQGSQSVGMGKYLYDNFSLAKSFFEEASDAISVDLKKLCFEGPEEELMKTENTQPAIVLVSIITTDVLKTEFGINPLVVAGHSVGEYAAAYAAGCVSLADAVRSVKYRGRYMQEAVPAGVGGMAAIMGLEAETVVNLCQWVTKNSNMGALEAANFNAPGQVVISGHSQAITWLSKNLDKYPWPEPEGQPKRLKIIPLKVSAPFHCSLMKPAQDKMTSLFKGIGFDDPTISFVQNVTADISKTKEDVKRLLIEQISAPVRWIECTERLKNLEVSKMVEVGSGQVLKGLTKKIWPEMENFKSTNSLEDLKLVAE